MNNKPLAKLLEVAQAITQGDYSKEVEIDAEGIIAQLAAELNNTVRNLRGATTSFSEATDTAPTIANAAQSVAGLMDNATKIILDSADRIVDTCKKVESGHKSDISEEMTKIKNWSLDIISSQSFQDAARQKLEVMEKELESVRDALLDAMIMMNLRSAETQEEIQQSREKLLQTAAPKNEATKQDLVDELLAEFGL